MSSCRRERVGLRSIEALEAELEDARTVERFWRNCAEQALRLWERAQDELEAVKAQLPQRPDCNAEDCVGRCHRDLATPRPSSKV